LFKGLVLVCPKEKPNEFSKAKDKGTDITLMRLGTSIEKEYIPGSITLGPISSPRYNAGIALQPKYTTHKTLAA
tara:strand:- start:570 stop:791 length:222 start_codon:yes stop_codon:yes gene_type:complete